MPSELKRLPGKWREMDDTSAFGRRRVAFDICATELEHAIALELRPLVEALRKLTEAAELATSEDATGDEIDGSLLDAARAALASFEEREPKQGENNGRR